MNDSAAPETIDTPETLVQDPEILAQEEPSPAVVITEPAAIMTTRKEKFIPVTRFAILDRLTKPENWRTTEYESARRLLSYLGNWRHQDYCRRLLRLKECYFPFSPDRDTVRILQYSKAELDAMQVLLVKSVTELIVQANYTEITQEDINSYFEEQSPYGLNLKVDLSEFEEVLVYCRGADTLRREFRSWKSLYLQKEIHEIPIFQRLFLLLKLKPEEVRIREIMTEHQVERDKAIKILKRYRRNLPDHASSDHVYLKLFKQINQSDLEMLFPNTQVEFKLLDKIKLGVTAGGGTMASVVGTATKALAATNPITLLGALAGLIAVIFRQIMKFFNQRNQYMMVLAQNLYFHNLANNRGVLTLMCDRAEEEDIKEDMLLYSYLTQQKVRRSSLREVDEAIEAYLESEFGVTVDFDIEDALGRLMHDGLVVETAEGDLQAVAPAVACAHMESQWKTVLARDAAEKRAHA